MEELKLENEENINEIETLKKEIQKLQNATIAEQQQSRDLKRDESADLRTSHLTLDFTNKSILERQEGEVMHLRKDTNFFVFTQIINLSKSFLRSLIVLIRKFCTMPFFKTIFYFFTGNGSARVRNNRFNQSPCKSVKKCFSYISYQLKTIF